MVLKSHRGDLATAQHDAYDKGFFGEESSYQKGSRNYKAYLLGQDDRQMVEEYADLIVKEW